MVYLPLCRNHLHLMLYYFILFQNAGQLLLPNNEQLAFTVGNGSAVPDGAAVLAEHVGVAEVGALHVHIERNVDGIVLALRDVVTNLDSPLHYKIDLLSMLSLVIEYIS
jgi:hypothetical protein